MAQVFLWNLQHFKEREEVTEAFWQWIFSLVVAGIVVRVFVQEAPKTLKMTFRLCTFVGAHRPLKIHKTSLREGRTWAIAVRGVRIIPSFF